MASLNGATMRQRLGRRVPLIALAIAVVVLVPVLLLAAQRPGAAGATVLTIFDGSTSVAHGSADFVAAHDGDVLAAGDTVRTDDAGHALVTFFDGSTLELEPATTVRVDGAAPAASGAIAITLTQAIGRTWASVQKLARPDSKFEIRTPSSTAAVRGTAFLTEVLPSGDTTVATSDGTVAVSARGQTVLVTEGLTTTVRQGEPPAAPTARPHAANTLRFGMHSPAYLAIVDPLGRSCGITGTGAVVRQVPGCVTTAPGTEPQILDVPNAGAGTYRALIAAIEPGGAFTLSATGLDGVENVSFDLALRGSAAPGALLASSLEVRTGADGRLLASGLTPLVVLQGATPSPSASASPSPTPSGTATSSIVPRLPLPTLPTRTVTPTPAPTETRTPVPTATPSATPSASPTASPTSAPPTPTPAPTLRTPNPGCSPSSDQNNTCH